MKYKKLDKWFMWSLKQHLLFVVKAQYLLKGQGIGRSNLIIIQILKKSLLHKMFEIFLSQDN